MASILKVRDADGTVHEIYALQGKSAYQYAVEGGYTGTEAEFAAKLAKEKFANPYALTFTGAVTGSYDGSEAVTVEIPSGGVGSADFPNWRLIKTIFITSGINFYEFDVDDSGNSFALKEIIIRGTVPTYSGYIYMKPASTGSQNALWPTAGKDMIWWSAAINEKLKSILAVSSGAVVWPTDKDVPVSNNTINKLIIGASNGFSADGNLYVYGR